VAEIYEVVGHVLFLPLLSSHPSLKVTFSCPVIENLIGIGPLLRGHLSLKTTFSLSIHFKTNGHCGSLKTTELKNGQRI
jgi:hypothetical protein